MKNLLKTYGFQNMPQYFDMIIESVINGQRTQAKEQFKAMNKENKKCFLIHIFNNDVELSQSEKNEFLIIF
jgi:hypothetical protein